MEINRRIRYKERLLQFNIISHYIPGTTNELTDALSRPKITHSSVARENEWKFLLVQDIVDLYYDKEEELYDRRNVKINYM